LFAERLGLLRFFDLLRFSLVHEYPRSSNSKAAEWVNRDGFALSPIRAVVSDDIVQVLGSLKQL
jgi:hypothetical protein